MLSKQDPLCVPSCTRGEGCSSLLSIKTSDFKVIAYAYLVIAIALTNQPALPLIPSVTTAHSEQPIETLLPFRRRRMDRTLAATVDIPQVLQGRTVGSIVIPYRKLKQYSSEYKLYFTRPVFAQMRLIEFPQVSKHIQSQHPNRNGKQLPHSTSTPLPLVPLANPTIPHRAVRRLPDQPGKPVYSPHAP